MHKKLYFFSRKVLLWNNSIYYEDKARIILSAFSTPFIQKEQSNAVRQGGIEPPTNWLRVNCSANWATGAFFVYCVSEPRRLSPCETCSAPDTVGKLLARSGSNERRKVSLIGPFSQKDNLTVRSEWRSDGEHRLGYRKPLFSSRPLPILRVAKMNNKCWQYQ